MLDRGLLPDFGGAVLEQLTHIPLCPTHRCTICEICSWCSIDNDDSRDLDQLTVSETVTAGAARILVAVADVDTLVAKDPPTRRPHHLGVHGRTDVLRAARAALHRSQIAESR
jgi:exoribonuclease-2